MIDVRDYGHGTRIVVEMPFGSYRGATVLCSDGRVRECQRISPTADTFFSIPAAVRVKGKSVSGYVTFDEVEGVETATFHRVDYAKNASLLPAGSPTTKEPR